MAIRRSRVKPVVWIFIVGACAFIDLIQIALDIFFQIGVIANRFIDVGVGIFYTLFLTMAGELSGDPNRLWKRIGALGFSLLLEEIPDVDGLPFWTLDALYDWRLSSQRNKQAAAEEQQEQEAVIVQEVQAREDAIIQAQNVQILREKYGAVNGEGEASRSASLPNQALPSGNNSINPSRLPISTKAPPPRNSGNNTHLRDIE